MQARERVLIQLSIIIPLVGEGQETSCVHEGRSFSSDGEVTAITIVYIANPWCLQCGFSRLVVQILHMHGEVFL